jgi:Fe-S cluster assembly iron-binding protein IscA
MIRVTEEARRHILRFLAAEGVPEGGLRIAVTDTGDDEGDVTCELETVGRSEPGDTVLETGGVRLFLDSGAAAALDDAGPGAQDGELALVPPEPSACAPG